MTSGLQLLALRATYHRFGLDWDWSDSTVENGCLQIIPGSHRRVAPHVESTPEVQFNRMGDPDYLDLSEIGTLEMEPGQFILFNERTLHQSDPNHSNRHRIGLAVRVIIPIVKVLDWDSPEHMLITISGKDRLGINNGSENGTAVGSSAPTNSYGLYDTDGIVPERLPTGIMVAESRQPFTY